MKTASWAAVWGTPVPKLVNYRQNLKLAPAGVTVRNIPTREIIPPVYFRIQKSVKNILGVCFCIKQYIMGNTYDKIMCIFST